MSCPRVRAIRIWVEDLLALFRNYRSPYLRPEHAHPLVEWRIGDLPFVLACKEAPSLSRLNRAACQSVCRFSLCRTLRLRSIGKTKRNVEPPGILADRAGRKRDRKIERKDSAELRVISFSLMFNR